MSIRSRFTWVLPPKPVPTRLCHSVTSRDTVSHAATASLRSLFSFKWQQHWYLRSKRVPEGLGPRRQSSWSCSGANDS
jgi:hypothetical protein